MAKDPHAVLGVAKGATPDQIKSAYRRQAQKHHPDRNPDDPGAAVRFQEIQAAFQSLSGSPGRANQGPTMPPDISDLFNMFDTVFRRANEPVVVLPVTLEMIAKGGHHTFDVDSPEPCSCSPARRPRCPLCHGTGVLRHRRRSYEVDIPMGAPDGLRFKARSTDTPRQEQAVMIQTQPHAVFQRQGDDLVRAQRVNYPDLVLGGAITTEGLFEPLTLTIPAGVRPGQSVRLAGRGLPRLGGGFGDMYLQVEVAIPDTLTARQRKAMEELAQALAEG